MALRRFTITPLFVATLLCNLGLSAQEYVNSIGVNTSQTEFTVNMVAPDAFLIEISGPSDYYWRAEVADQKDITIGNTQPDGTLMPDGQYTLQVTPIFKLSEAQRAELQAIRAQQDEEALKAFRTLHQLPSSVERYTVYYQIQDGKFADPNLKEPKTAHYAYQWDHQAAPQFIDPPATFASITHKKLHYAKRILGQAEPMATDNTPLAEDAQVFVQDVIIQGSSCVGFDCVNGESFGFDTQRYKENNLRIHFNDTSNSGSFPSADWRISINDSTNGGANYFSIDDATSGRSPFRIEASAPSNSLYVDNGGDVGFGTSTPVVEMHSKDGDTPTLRLEQDGSSGWTPQTWDVAGNETNFFIRDVTGGSNLPFKIRPGADDNSLVINNNNNIGIGTLNPTSKLQVESGDLYLKSGSVGINTAPNPSTGLTVQGGANITGASFFSGDVTFISSSSVSFFNGMFIPIMSLDATTGFLGLGNPPSIGHLLTLGADDAVKPGGGAWSTPSDRRLKEDIRDFEDGLELLMNIRPVRYRYNGKMNMPTDKDYIGIIAQEIQELAPYTIRPLNVESDKNKTADYLAFDDTPLVYIAINAIQEQQAVIEAQQQEIDDLKAQLSEMEALKAQMEALSARVGKLQEQQQDGTAPKAAAANTKK
jgi:hypothetical protein